MDKLLGGIIDDYILYKVIAGLIMILILAAVYLAIQIILTWKFLNKEEAKSDEVISNKKSFYRSSIFIFITGFFMLIHEFLESLEENAPDNTTNELFQFVALLGLVLFMVEWDKILNKYKKNRKLDIGLHQI